MQLEIVVPSVAQVGGCRIGALERPPGMVSSAACGATEG